MLSDPKLDRLRQLIAEDKAKSVPTVPTVDPLIQQVVDILSLLKGEGSKDFSIALMGALLIEKYALPTEQGFHTRVQRVVEKVGCRIIGNTAGAITEWRYEMPRELPIMTNGHLTRPAMYRTHLKP